MAGFGRESEGAPGQMADEGVFTVFLWEFFPEIEYELADNLVVTKIKSRDKKGPARRPTLKCGILIPATARQEAQKCLMSNSLECSRNKTRQMYSIYPEW